MLSQSDFDLDLKYGEDGEKWLTWLASEGAKVEVKTERDIWHRTKNIFIEYKYKGNPSGLAVTKSDYWVTNLKKGNKTFATVVVETKRLKKNLKRLIKNGKVSIGKKGGDFNMSEGILLPLDLLHEIFD
jgi:hypothetical protein|tara:strand:- start:456 stop:842 length:387 start_codon:yes stop_codon:yes gene_type:complete